MKRNNLRLAGIKEGPNETGKDCKKDLYKLVKESLGITEKGVIEKAHRVKTDKNKKVVWKILNYKDKVKILRNAKKT